ncbi:hypothetical protein AUR64_14630 [Haloprofundus marisrubri]|uniref:Glycosyltransferase RgtA/B/C/D-like domain-containing protein n=1 Tax=Haloprofundus marisrubri TaxID=1514971 RepID=A0A0W1R6I7_9EURY|nr:hypothetical protein [Haloprofundus marisrubri]KTG09035.1 hypothetical protein AUR64_14630 [Haloprofundus marisrubri]
MKDLKQRIVAAVFGDRSGLALFLLSLAFFGLFWRVGVFVNDTYTVANAFVGVADGHLYVDELRYGPADGATPGMNVVDGYLYGRNYGQMALALPILWLLELGALVADPRLVVVGLWCFTVLGACVVVGRVVDRPVMGNLVGAVAAIGLFGVNLLFATPLDPKWFPLMALQLASMVTAALAGVAVYRLLACVADRRAGLVSGAILVVATPVGFWASLPKRHATMALVVAVVLYTFYRSREVSEERPNRALGFRSAAYATVGLSTWVQPAEALTLFVALAAVDFLTVRRTDWRTLGVVAVAFALSLVPFLVTNAVVTGNPLSPPRLWTRFTGDQALTIDPTSGASGELTGGDSGTGSDGSASTAGLVASIGAVLGSALDRAALFAEYVRQGLVASFEPIRLYRIFVRSGYLSHVAGDDGGEAVNMAFVESAPVLGVLIGVVPLTVRRVRERTNREWNRRSVHEQLRRLRRSLQSPRRATDLLAVASLWTFSLIYLHRLPLHAMVTVRYLVPLLPILVYAAVRLESVREALSEWATLAWSYFGALAIGGQLLLLVLLLDGVQLGEAIQLHALVHLAAAAMLALWVLVSETGLGEGSYPRLGAALVGVACGLTTVFLLLSGWEYFGYAGEFALPAVRTFTRALPLF